MSARIYLDTSFFIRLLENQEDNRVECAKILKWELSQDSSIFTSILTLNEFLIRGYNSHRKHPDCEKRIDKIENQIRSISNIYGFSVTVMKKAARLQSIWGEQNKQSGDSPRDRGFRWDTIHLATADTVGVARVYAFDDMWNKFPKEELQGIEEISSPAQLKQTEMDLPDK